MRRPHLPARRRAAAIRGPFAFASRHRAFAARLRLARDGEARAPGVACVLRRVSSRVLQLTRSPLHFALQLIHRVCAPPGAPRIAKALPAPGIATRHTHERLRVVMRLLERATLATRWRESHLLATATPPPVATTPAAAADSARIAMIQRVQQESRHPRVTQLMVRAAMPAIAREHAAAQAASQAPDVHYPSRPVATLAPSPVAAALPAAELSRVTDHVIRQLDRRVLSYRERMGRS